MSKYSTFSHYRSELINIVRRLEYVENGKTVEWAKFAHIEESYIYLGHFFIWGIKRQENKQQNLEMK